MSLNTGRDKLAYAHKHLTAAYEQASSEWRDGVAQEFKEQAWEPLDEQVRATLMAMDRLAAVLHQLRRDCE
jgi:hypothetical protein